MVAGVVCMGWFLLLVDMLIDLGRPQRLMFMIDVRDGGRKALGAALPQGKREVP